ncbi:MAG: hypothetical protein KGI58_03170 [Patescibacteria group bacterium]|nr:hypothetical protein [Patescibacteria group bacterium]
MLLKHIIVYKKQGETPLECLERTRFENNIEEKISLTYAGRLDPMAEGVMIILVGDECKNKEQYLGLDKTYEFQILVGFATDTYDLLGIVESSSKKLRMVWPSFPKNLARKSEDLSNYLFDDETLNITLQSFIRTFIQKYPSFSSKTVGGKQLFQLSKDNNLPGELPEHEVTIKKLEHLKTEIIKSNDLQKEILKRISLVHGDFRQKEIIEKWNEVFSKSNQKEYQVLSCVAECSSGTYIRQLVADISEKTNVPMVTYSIKRTRIGAFTE